MKWLFHLKQKIDFELCFKHLWFFFINRTLVGSVPHKSPEEIALISDGKPIGKLKASRSDRRGGKNGGGGWGSKKKSPKKMDLPPPPIQTPMCLPNQFDWNRLNQLTRNSKGEYTLIGRLSGRSDVSGSILNFLLLCFHLI